MTGFNATPGAVEREFGIPIPGVILPEDQWVRTALKQVPEGHIDWAGLFGRTAPVIIDIGCGNGRSVLTGAVAHPDRDYLGIDILPVVIRYATRRGNQRGLSNTRWAVIGGRELLAEHVAAGSISEIHCYHPQPWYRRDQVPLRLITPEFLRLVHQSLQPGGRFVLQTDHPGYWKYMLRILPLFFEWTARTDPWPFALQGLTRREIIARQRGLPIFRGEGTARLDLDAEAAIRMVEALPLPLFNADRRLQALDQLEKEGTGSNQRAGRRPGSRSGPPRRTDQRRPPKKPKGR